MENKIANGLGRLKCRAWAQDKILRQAKKVIKRACESIRNKYSKGFGNGRAAIEGPAKVRSERTTALIPAFFPQEKEEYCEMSVVWRVGELPPRRT